MPAEDPCKWMCASAAIWECLPDLLCRWSPSFHKVRLWYFSELYLKLSSSGKLPLPCAQTAKFVVSDTTSAQRKARKTASLDPSRAVRGTEQKYVWFSDRRSPACFPYRLGFLQLGTAGFALQHEHPWQPGLLRVWLGWPCFACSCLWAGTPASSYLRTSLFTCVFALAFPGWHYLPWHKQVICRHQTWQRWGPKPKQTPVTFYKFQFSDCGQRDERGIFIKQEKQRSGTPTDYDGTHAVSLCDPFDVCFHIGSNFLF